MPEPIPDFTQDEHHAVTRTLLDRFMHVHPAHEGTINLLPERLSAVAGGGERVVRT